MGLAKIRENNKRKDNFVNTTIDYKSLSANDIKDVRNNVFKGFIEPLSNKSLEKSMNL